MKCAVDIQLIKNDANYIQRLSLEIGKAENFA